MCRGEREERKGEGRGKERGGGGWEERVGEEEKKGEEGKVRMGVGGEGKARKRGMAHRSRPLLSCMC